MKRLFLLVCAGVALTTLAAAQPKKTAPRVSAPSAASICDDPYQVRELADGWPEGPVTVLFHREKSKLPWSRNPAIKLPGLEAASPSAARTLVCVEESRLEMGHYESGEAGYTPSWSVILVRLADRKVYFLRGGFYGAEPPGIKFNRGAGVGRPAIEIFVRWLRLVVDQKVARLKLRLKSKQYEAVSALAFSPNGARLAVAQEARSTGAGTPPSPITLFDLSSAQPVATLVPNVFAKRIAISRSGNLIAADVYRHVDVWDAAAGKVVHKVDSGSVDSLLFGPNDTLAVAGENKAVLWDVSTERALRSAAGSYMTLSPDDVWLVAKKDKSGVAVQELVSGRELGNFPPISGESKFAVTGNGSALATFSIFSATMHVTGSSQAYSLALPNLGVNTLAVMAPTRDGFVIANGDAIVGVVSVSKTEVRAFATDHSAITALAVSADGKLLAVGDSSGNVSIWEFR